VIATDDSKSSATKQLLHGVHSVFQRRKVVLGTVGPVEPFAKTLKPKDARATAYVCTGTACQPPTDNALALAGLLK
jgi:uncharacterized protein YyaL (SSP411 family)